MALGDRTRHDAFRLRYDSYLASGHIAPNEQRLFSDDYDDLPNCVTAVVYSGIAPVASVRVCKLELGSGHRSPALDTFRDEVETLLGRQTAVGGHKRGIETTRLVRSPEVANKSNIVFLLYRIAGCIGLDADAQILFACVRQNHVPFYRRLGYEAVSEPRDYPGLSCAMSLMACTRARYDELRSTMTLIDPERNDAGNLAGLLEGRSVQVSLGRS